MSLATAGIRYTTGQRLSGVTEDCSMPEIHYARFPEQVRHKIKLVRAKVRCVCCVVSFNSLSTLSQKSATICRRKVRLSQKSATVAEFRRCLAVFGDSRAFLRQCGQGFTSTCYCQQVGNKLSASLYTGKLPGNVLNGFLAYILTYIHVKNL